MFPIAYAVVEAKTIDSWAWFLELLLSDLNQVQKRRWSFISDQHKVTFIFFYVCFNCLLFECEYYLFFCLFQLSLI